MTYCLLPLTKKSFNSDHKIDSILDKSMPDVKKKVWMSDSRLMVLVKILIGLFGCSVVEGKYLTGWKTVPL